MAESIGMQIVNQRCEDIIRTMGTHELSVVDLARIELRFKKMATLCRNSLSKIEEDLQKELDKIITLCDTCSKADKSCPVYPMETQTCVEYHSAKPEGGENGS